MSQNAHAHDSTDSESFEPPFPENSRGYARIEDLKPFHLEDETYTERDNAELVASIEEHGFREGERVTICPDGTILLGHRRVDAADQYGMERVPVYVEGVEPDSLEARSIFLSSNQYRDKTPGEKINEGLLWEQIEQERAQERESSGGVQDFAQGDAGKTRDKVGEKIGMSGESYRKGKRVKEADEGGNKVAQSQWVELFTGEQTIHGAYKAVREAEEDEDTHNESEDSSPGRDEDSEGPDDDGEDTSTDGDGESADIPNVTSEGDPFHGEQDTENERQGDTGDAGSASDGPSPAESEEADSGPTDGGDSGEDTEPSADELRDVIAGQNERIQDLQDRTCYSEEEIETVTEKIEEAIPLAESKIPRRGQKAKRKLEEVLEVLADE